MNQTKVYDCFSNARIPNTHAPLQIRASVVCDNDISARTGNLHDTIIPKDYKSNFECVYFFRLGYRLLALDGFLLRLAPLALLEYDPPKSSKLRLRYSLGLSLGYSF